MAMRLDNPWMLLRTGRIKQGLQHFEAAYKSEPSSSTIMELGVAYLWVEQHESAWKHFSKSIAQYPHSISSFYGMAGVAKWCLGEAEEAVRQWTAGLEADFADANGLGVQLPLLLFTASMLAPSVVQRTDVEEMLERRVSTPRDHDWPAPIARWLIGHITESQLLDQSIGSDDAETRDQQLAIDFYRAVLRYPMRSSGEFKLRMKELVDTTRPEWLDPDFFLARMWSEEFFLARHEAGK